MGRGFSEWVADQKTAGATAQVGGANNSNSGRQRFLVDNSLLRSDSSGLRFRSSVEGDKNRALRPLAWGRCVWGTLDPSGAWLKVKPGRYLPVTLQGVPVLKLLHAEPEPFEEELEEVLWLSPLKANLMGGSSGSSYEILAEKLALRRGPSFNACSITWLCKGETVDVFGWDDTWQWRQCLEPRKKLLGWILLAREGEVLVKPHGSLEQWHPEALCDAAMEGRLFDLRRYLRQGPVESWPKDAMGRTPLELSVLHDHLPCAVRLLEAGADAEEALSECEKRGDTLDTLASALLSAFSGGEVEEVALQSALKSLDPSERSVARTQLARLVEGVKGDEASSERSTQTRDEISRVERISEGRDVEERSIEEEELELNELTASASEARGKPRSRKTRRERRRRVSFSGHGGHASRVSSPSASESETEAQGAEVFRSWLEERPSMCRLSTVSGVETGVAWDFPLTKSEKRELLLMYVTEGEKMAEETASQAQLEERRHRKSLESAKAALVRMRKTKCSGGRRSLGGLG